jgi:hypothetical protein
MSDHDDTHAERLARVVYDGAAATGDVLESLARCDACLTELARALEDATLLGPAQGARAPRLAAILDEAFAWRAVADDVAAGTAGVAVEAGASVEATVDATATPGTPRGRKGE